MRNINLYDRIRRWAGHWTAIPSEISGRSLLAIPFTAMIMVAGPSFRVIADERLFHIDPINAFATAWPISNIADYLSAPTSLLYVLWTIYGKVVGLEIWKLCLLAVIGTCLTVNLFYSLCRRYNLLHPLLSILLLLIILGEAMNHPWSTAKGKLMALLVTLLITLTPYIGERYCTLTVPYLTLLLHRSFHFTTADYSSSGLLCKSHCQLGHPSRAGPMTYKVFRAFTRHPEISE